MSRERLLTLGICSEEFNEETIKRLLRKLNLAYTAFIVKDIEHDNVGLFDILFFINPTLNDRQIKTLEKYVREGTSVALMISGEDWNYGPSESLLSYLGVKVQKTHRTKRLSLKYTASYPLAFRRGKKEVLTSPQKAAYAMLSLDRNSGPKKKTPLITASTLFSDYHFAIKLEFGRGIVLVMNSRSFSDDRSELIGYLMTEARERKVDSFAEMIERIRNKLPTIIEDAFDVYDEVPLTLVAQRAGIDRLILQQFDFMLEIENLIRHGEIFAKIQGNYIIRV